MNKQKMKKIRLFLMFVIIVSLFLGCSRPAQTTTSDTDEEGIYTPGTYIGEAQGYGGILRVQVVLDKDNIVSVEVLDHNESAGIGDAAISILPEKIVENQKLGVDVVAGASYSSLAILEAVEKAMMLAGADIDLLKIKSEINQTSENINKVTDVVVVGGGIAGLSAALEAINQGAKVILVEKMPFVGGSSIRSGGKILAANTSIQAALGIEDNPSDFADFLMEIGENQVDEDFINLIAYNSADNIEWLIENGVELAQEIEPLHSYRTPPRGHYTANGSGAGVITPLEAKLKEKGAEILYSTSATDLIYENSRVIGIQAENSDGDQISIYARAVILATGGFTRNPDLVAQYFPSLGNFVTGTGEGNTGDGIVMGISVGADVIMPDAGIDLMLNFITYDGYGEAATELFVTPNGERFMDERDFHFKRTRILYDYGVDHFWYIIDAKSYDDGVAAAVQSGMAYEADSIEALATQIDVEPDVLIATVARYNELCELGEDTDFNKSSEYMVSIEESKFYALTMTKSNSGTHGGLKTNIDAQVIDTNGNVIPGLYAAGEVACGQIFYKEYPGSGSALISFLTFGRQAGAAAAKEK